MKKNIKILLCIFTIIIVIFLCVGYPDWKKYQIEKTDLICKINICQIGNSTEYNVHVYASKFNNCACLDYPYTKKIEKLYWLTS